MPLTYPEALVVGALQGVSELFPVSSLGHAVLVPALVGGRWAADLDVSAPESPYLAFIVGLHVATALALIVFYRHDWARIVGGMVDSLRTRRVATSEARLGWLLVLATIPVGLTGLALEHLFRTTLGRPVPAAAFLVVNGLILLAGERLRRGPCRAPGRRTADTAPRTALDDPVRDHRATADLRRTGGPHCRQLRVRHRRLAVPGAPAGNQPVRGPMVAGLTRGLNHRDAARFSFLLATPVILAAGVLKLPDLAGPLGEGVRGPVLAGSAASFVAAYASVRWLTRWFQTRTLSPFAIYCLVAGGLSLVVLLVR